jgi:hypothetical protein
MAVRKVSMKHPHFPPDMEFGVNGVGSLKNDGSPVEVDEDEFQARTGVSLQDAFGSDPAITVEGVTKRPKKQAADLSEVLTPQLSENEGGDNVNA